MFKRSALLVAVVLPLAACDSGPTVEAENATVGEVAAAVDEAGITESFVSPGKWRSTVTFEDLSMPGMTAEMAAQMKKQMASQTTSTETCLTEADVQKPSADFFAGQDQSCKYDRFSMGSGKMNMQMTCDRGGAAQVMTMTGTYSKDRYAMTASSQGTGAASGMTMKLRIDSQRIGECTAAEKAAG